MNYSQIFHKQFIIPVVIMQSKLNFNVSLLQAVKVLVLFKKKGSDFVQPL